MFQSSNVPLQGHNVICQDISSSCKTFADMGNGNMKHRLFINKQRMLRALSLPLFCYTDILYFKFDNERQHDTAPQKSRGKKTDLQSSTAEGLIRISSLVKDSKGLIDSSVNHRRRLTRAIIILIIL